MHRQRPRKPRKEDEWQDCLQRQACASCCADFEAGFVDFFSVGMRDFLECWGEGGAVGVSSRLEEESCAALGGSFDVGIAGVCEPVDAGEVLRFEAAAAAAVASDGVDFYGDSGEGGEAEGDAKELAAAFEGAAVEFDGVGHVFPRCWSWSW